YPGPIPYSSLDRANDPGNNPIISMILGAQKRPAAMFGSGQGDAPGGHENDLQLQMSVGADGLVNQVSVTFQRQETGSSAGDGTYTWTGTYSHLGPPPPIPRPPAANDVPPGTRPADTAP